MKKRTILLVSGLLALAVIIFIFMLGKTVKDQSTPEDSVQVESEKLDGQTSEEEKENPGKNETQIESELSTQTGTDSEQSEESKQKHSTEQQQEAETESPTKEKPREEQADKTKEKEAEEEKTPESDDRIQDALEDGFPRIVVSNVEAKPGDTVIVAATLVNNPGVLGMSMTLSYDDSVLELLSVKNGEAFSEVLTMSNSKTLESGCVFLWDGENVLEEQILDGSILNLTFKISEGASAGKLPITVICNEGGIVDNNLQTVDIAVENGFIKIKE